MADENKKSGYSLILSEDEKYAIEQIRNMTIYKGLDLSIRKAITVALLGYSKTDVLSEILQELAQMKVAFSEASSRIVRGGPGRPPKPTAEDERETGLNICTALGGTVAGETCYYQKHEVTAIGKAAFYEVGIPLTSLGKREVEDQYWPNKEEWEKVYAEQNKK